MMNEYLRAIEVATSSVAETVMQEAATELSELQRVTADGERVTVVEHSYICAAVV